MQGNNNQERSASELLEEFRKKYNVPGSNKENITESYKSDTGMQEQVTEESIAQDSISFGTSGVGINLNPEGVDSITESIRKEILEKQREQLRLYFSSLAATRPELAEHILDDERFNKFLANLKGEHRLLVNDALASEKVKAAMEEIEIVGYRNIHNSFSVSASNPNGFKPMDWKDFTEGNGREVNSRLQIVRNEAGAEIATLKEQTHKTTPLTISKQDGAEIIVNSYRTIDLPVNLEEPASGTMHLSLVARDKDGKAPPLTKAVYFTAHYEATPKPNGVPKLKEVSSPVPIKFLGSSMDAIGYIEHGGEIYTLPVTKGKYEEMIREVAKNKGQAIDLSLEVERKAQDLISSIEQISGADEDQIARYEKILEEHIEPALKCRDKEREKILLLTKKYLTDVKYQEIMPYIRKTAKQHIEMHHEAYLEESDGGKALSELCEIMKNIGCGGFGKAGTEAIGSERNDNITANSDNIEKIKSVLKAGAKLGFNVVLESLKTGGIDVYLRKQAVKGGQKVGSYVASCIADRLKSSLCSKKPEISCNTVSEPSFTSYVVASSHSKSKSSGVSK